MKILGSSIHIIIPKMYTSSKILCGYISIPKIITKSVYVTQPSESTTAMDAIITFNILISLTSWILVVFFIYVGSAIPRIPSKTTPNTELKMSSWKVASIKIPGPISTMFFWLVIVPRNGFTTGVDIEVNANDKTVPTFHGTWSTLVLIPSTVFSLTEKWSFKTICSVGAVTEKATTWKLLRTATFYMSTNAFFVPSS